jgi:hypothetical protein
MRRASFLTLVFAMALNHSVYGDDRDASSPERRTETSVRQANIMKIRLTVNSKARPL